MAFERLKRKGFKEIAKEALIPTLGVLLFLVMGWGVGLLLSLIF